MTIEPSTEFATELPAESYQVLFEHIQDGVFVIRNGVVVFVNHIIADLVGCTPTELIGQIFTDFIAPEDRDMVRDRYRRRIAGETVEHAYELRLLHKNGVDRRYVLLNIGVILTGTAAGSAVGTVKDITEMRQTLDALQQAQQEYQTLRDTIADVFYRTDRNGIVTDMSAACFDTLGYRPEEMIGRKLTDFYVHPEERGKIVELIRENNGHATSVESALRHRDGHAIWVSTNAYLRRDLQGTAIGIEGIARDITARKNMEDELRALSTRDDLTGCFNRRYFIAAVEQELERSRRYRSTLALLILDIDLFKNINDTHGHPSGDAVLRQFAELCKNTMRRNDVFARMGGEEFAVLMPETDGDHTRQLCERLRSEVERMVFRDERDDPVIRITISIGVTVSANGGTTFSQLYSRADRAMYEAKNSGRNCCRFNDA